MSYKTSRRPESGAHRPPRPICFYLPQFHRIPENDRWWGEGFTEWSLVKNARAFLSYQQQPVHPHPDIGYYNLMDAQTRKRQGEIARQYGIYGFCYYHYWFHGKRLLQGPLQQMLNDGYPDLPFCLCWANEPWTRTWSGLEQDVLQAQHYGDEADWKSHFETLLPFLRHPNAIRVNETPMLLIYRSGHIPKLASMVDCWRELARAAGIEDLHLLGVLGNFSDNRQVPACLDGAVEHHPGIFAGTIDPLVNRGIKIFPMESAWSRSLQLPRRHKVQYPGACLHWDNTPRAGFKAGIFCESTPARAVGYLSRLADRVVADRALPEPFVFVNSWNEWSEGAYIEPDQETGYQRLEILNQGFHGPHRSFDALPVEQDAALSASVDTDTLNVLVNAGLKSTATLEFGCGTGATGIHARPYLGSERYLGLENEPENNHLAAERLSEALRLNGKTVASLIAAGELFNLVIAAETARCPGGLEQLLEWSRRLLADQGRMLVGFFNSQHHAAIGRRSAPNAMALSDARRILIAAGFKVDQIFRVYQPAVPDLESLPPNDNKIMIGERVFQGLNPRQVENLYTLRLFLLLSRSEPTCDDAD